MQITSDDQFQELDGADILSQQINIEEQNQPKPPAQKNKYSVEIVEIQNEKELGIVENQYYNVRVLKNGTNLHNQSIKRRFSDFDFLFDTLFKKYQGKILPGFPEKGIISYVKTKVTMMKNEEYLRNRKIMVERFLNIILNDQEFDCQRCQETKKFFSEREFDLFKKAGKQNSENMFTASWNKFVNYLKFGKQNKYKCITEKIIQDKKAFQSLFNLIKETIQLLKEQEKEYQMYQKLQYKFQLYDQYILREKKMSQKQEKNLSCLEQLKFYAQCENEDFSMVLKIIESIEQLRSNEANTQICKKVEKRFQDSQKNFEQEKKRSYVEIKNKFQAILVNIQKTDEDF